MHAQLTRPLVALVAVVAAYGGYALLAVPLIEPPVSRLANADGVEIDPNKMLGSRYDRLLANWFPADSWERQRPKVLEFQQMILLLKDYGTSEAGRLEFQPCTVVFFLNNDKDNPRPLILRAPRGHRWSSIDRSICVGPSLAGSLADDSKDKSPSRPHPAHPVQGMPCTC